MLGVLPFSIVPQAATLIMKLQLNTSFLNQNTLLAILACAQVSKIDIEVEPVQDGMRNCLIWIHSDR